MERFENTIDNVSELEVKCYTDPVNMEHTIEIWAKTGEEEYIYKFAGPGVRIANIPMLDDCLKLSKEIEKLTFEKEMMKKENDRIKAKSKDISDDNALLLETNKKLKQENEELKKENEDFGNQILDYIEMNRKLSEENKKEVHKVKELAADNDRLENKIRDLQVDNKFLKRQVNKTAEAVKNLQKENKKLKEEYEKKIKELEELKTPTIENFADEEPRTRADILDQAKKCVCGQREQDYGTPESNFQLIADLWNGYLGFMDHPQDQIRATDVAMMMALMKIARIRNGGGSGDSFVDLAGYAACGGEIWHGE